MNGKSNRFGIPRGIWVLVVLLMSGGFLSHTAWAEVRSGVGIMAGVTDTSVEPATSSSVDIDGTSLGIDFQIPLGEMFSLNPFYLVASESGSQPEPPPILTSELGMDSTALGVQLRLWFDDFFAGVHVAQYKVEFKVNSVKVAPSLDEIGYGLAVGYENPIGIFLILRTDAVTVELPADPIGGFPAEDIKINSVRAYLGYRF